MSRPRRSPEENADEQFRKALRIRQGELNLMTQRKLSDRTGIAQSTLSKRIADPSSLTAGEMRKIVAGVRPDPRAFLLLIGYTAKEITGV